jgi:hypothetical protein
VIAHRSNEPLKKAYLTFAMSSLSVSIGLLITACGAAHGTATASTHASASTEQPSAEATLTVSPAPIVEPSSAPPKSSHSLIPDTKADRRVCRAFATEQDGQVTADQFNVWLLQNGNPAANKLINNLADWFVNRSMNPQEAEGYVAQVFADCGSIHVLV